MKKTITINLGGIEFSIDEDAYTELNAYIDNLKAHFASYEDQDEIIADIESRFAEQFTEKLKSNGDVVTMAHVKEALEAMGDVDEMDDEEEASMHKGEKKENPWAGKRLYRDTEHAVIGGVAAGISNYLGIDPTIIRIIFLILTFANGLGVIAYIIFWLAMPEAKTLSDKMAMRGEQMTLNNIEQGIKRGWNKAKKAINNDDDKKDGGSGGTSASSGATDATTSKLVGADGLKNDPTSSSSKDENKTAENGEHKTSASNSNTDSSKTESHSTLEKIVELPFQLIAQVFQVVKKFVLAVLPIIGAIVGTVFTLTSFILIVVFTFIGVVFLFQLQTNLVDVQIADIVTGTAYYALVIGAYMLALLPSLFFFLVGLSLIRRRNFVLLPVFLVIIGGWIVAGLVTSTVGIEYAQEVKERVDEVMQQDTVVQAIDIESFTGIDVSDAYTVNVTRGDELSLQIEGTEKLLEETRIEVNNGILRIDHFDAFHICLFTCFDRTATVTIISPQLESVEASGATTVLAKGFTEGQERLNVDISGASSFEMNGILVGAVTIDQSGASTAILSGYSKYLTGDISGASTLEAIDLITEEVTIELSGASEATVHASKYIEADVSGASDLTYSGTGSIDSDTSGASTVRRVDGVTEEAKDDDYKDDDEIEISVEKEIVVPELPFAEPVTPEQVPTETPSGEL